MKSKLWTAKRNWAKRNLILENNIQGLLTPLPDKLSQGSDDIVATKQKQNLVKEFKFLLP